MGSFPLVFSYKTYEIVAAGYKARFIKSGNTVNSPLFLFFLFFI